MQLEWQVPALTQGRVSISLCGHVSLHPLRGADCPAAPECHHFLLHTENVHVASYLQLGEQDRCSVWPLHTQPGGQRQGPAGRQTER